MRLQVLPQRVRILQHNQSSMLTVQTMGRLSKTTSVIISGQAAVKQLQSTSLLRAFATSLMVRCSASATLVSIGRRFRAARAAVATRTSTRATCTRCTTAVGLLGSRRVRWPMNRGERLSNNAFPIFVPECRGASRSCNFSFENAAERRALATFRSRTPRSATLLQLFVRERRGASRSCNFPFENAAERHALATFRSRTPRSATLLQLSVRECRGAPRTSN